jgi:hypothetical protein
MTKIEAKRQLNIGYMILIIGVIIGFGFDNNSGISPLLFGYIVWSTYWGYKLLYKSLKKNLNNYTNSSPVHISSKDVFDYFHKVHQYRWLTELIIFFICYIVGVFGGSIFMQAKLSKIAYF